ncbi:hypothetical protein K438DRAFT_2004596 [Mycena galopus ATCC 62051]|nr:hypothetical protein K438DRAFT_2004596 [Mycena galopus ATCC 62051]
MECAWPSSAGRRWMLFVRMTRRTYTQQGAMRTPSKVYVYPSLIVASLTTQGACSCCMPQGRRDVLRAPVHGARSTGRDRVCPKRLRRGYGALRGSCRSPTISEVASVRALVRKVPAPRLKGAARQAAALPTSLGMVSVRALVHKAPAPRLRALCPSRLFAHHNRGHVVHVDPVHKSPPRPLL